MDHLKFKAYAGMFIILIFGIEQANTFEEFIPFLIGILMMVFLLIGHHFIEKTLKK